MTQLAALYANGAGVPQDYTTALKWYSRAAEKGFRPAQYRIGVMHSYGQGVPQDHEKAVEWYRLAANRNYALAQRALGGKYAQGAGVPQDYAEAYKWIILSVRRLGSGPDYEKAVQMRDYIAEKLTQEQIDVSEKWADEWQAEGY
jgi:uncharacterized protein